MSDTDNDLDVLHPERTITLAGEQITVREYGNLEWLQLLASGGAPLVAAVSDALQRADAAAIYEDAFNVVCNFAPEMMPVVLQAVGRDMGWLERLSKNELEMLIATWWGINGPFFVQRAINRLQARVQAQVIADELSAGLKSTPPSLQPDTTSPT